MREGCCCRNEPGCPYRRVVFKVRENQTGDRDMDGSCSAGSSRYQRVLSDADLRAQFSSAEWRGGRHSEIGPGEGLHGRSYFAMRPSLIIAFQEGFRLTIERFSLSLLLSPGPG